MEKVRKKYIKYLGEVKALDEVINIEGLNEEEILDELIKFYIRSSKQITKERTKIYQELLKVTPKTIKIEKISNRWGSCNSKKEITYNYLISTLAVDLIDYIVVHELYHIHHMNHDRSFWRKVGSILPDYKNKIKMLEER